MDVESCFRHTGLENKIVQYADNTTLIALVRSPEMRDEVARDIN